MFPSAKKALVFVCSVVMCLPAKGDISLELSTSSESKYLTVSSLWRKSSGSIVDSILAVASRRPIISDLGHLWRIWSIGASMQLQMACFEPPTKYNQGNLRDFGQSCFQEAHMLLSGHRSSAGFSQRGRLEDCLQLPSSIQRKRDFDVCIPVRNLS